MFERISGTTEVVPFPKERASEEFPVAFKVARHPNLGASECFRKG